MIFILLLAIVGVVTFTVLITYLVRKATQTKLLKQKNVISFSGGGFRALSSDVGVMDGIRKRSGTNLEHILSNYRVMSGVSGGSWFMSLLVYSPTFYNMLDKGNKSSYTYEKYIENVINVIKNMKGWGAYCKNPHLSSLERAECYAINKIKDDLPLGFTEMLQYGGQPWQTTVEEMIFSHIDNMENVKLSSNPNNLNLNCVWGSSILKSGTLDLGGQLKDAKNANYYNMPDPIKKYCFKEECGLVFPISFNYDHKKSLSTTNIFPGQTTKSTQIDYNIGSNPMTQKTITTLNLKPPTDLYVKDVAACSGAAIGFASSENIVNQIDNMKGGIITSEEYKYFADFVRIFGSKMGVAMNLDNKLGFNTTGYVSPDKQVDNATVRAIDGGYYDDSSIAFSIKAWQQNVGSGVCHIVNVNAMPVNTSGHKTNTSISHLFGSTIDGQRCMSVVNEAKEYGLDTWGFTVDLQLPVIFPCKDFMKGTCLWWGREGDDKPTQCKPCNVNTNCAEISVYLYETVTIDNEELGIVGGTPVNLYVINTNTNTPIFPLPGDMLSQSGEYGTTNTVKLYTSAATLISNLIQKIPSDIFNAMFFDSTLAQGVRVVCGENPQC